MVNFNVVVGPACSILMSFPVSVSELVNYSVVFMASGQFLIKVISRISLRGNKTKFVR